MSGLFGSIYGRGPVAGAVSDHAWLQAMLDVEAALGGPARNAAEFDLDALGREAAEHVSPIVPLARCFPDTHTGATSQDIIDTAMMLVARRALGLLAEDIGAAVAACGRLAREHADLAVMGRTLGQPARPTSVGLIAAGWGVGIADAAAALASVPLAVQMGGPVGHRDPEVAERVAARLGLEAPVLSWHTDRTRAARLACAAGVLCGALAKPARDVTLSGYLREGVPGRGGSSAMPEKQNPVAAVSTLACTRRTPGLVATMLAAMEAEDQRAAGAWQSEWGTLSELLSLTGSAASWCRDLLEHLRVDAAAAGAGLDAGADLGASAILIDRALSHMERLSATGPSTPTGPSAAPSPSPAGTQPPTGTPSSPDPGVTP